MTRPQSALSNLRLALASWAAVLALAGCVTADADWGTVTTTTTDPKTGLVTVVKDAKRRTQYMDNRTGAALAGGLFGGIMDNLGPGGIIGTLAGGGGLLAMVGHLLGQNKGYTQAQVENSGLAPAAPKPAAPVAATGATT